MNSGQETGDATPVVLVAGPTASGKSGLALAVAEAFGGVVINADSMQVYRELAILTARPGAADLARAPHRLYGVLPGGDPCSAGRWREMARAEISAARSEGRLPIVVGGTGLYLRALEKGLAPLPAVPAAVRAEAQTLHAKLGAAGFHAALAARDPVAAARLNPNDRQRLIRAWEVLEATGRPLADWQAQEEGGDTSLRVLRLVLMPPREALYAAADARFRAMLSSGALDEVRALRRLDLDPRLPIMKTIGVRELGAHLDGALPLEAATERAQQATRNYAKRQMTWLRTQMPLRDRGSVLLNAQFSNNMTGKIFPLIRRFLLTHAGALD